MNVCYLMIKLAGLTLTVRLIRVIDIEQQKSLCWDSTLIRYDAIQYRIFIVHSKTDGKV